MGGIKYYQLAKGEELPDEFCAVRDMGGEPSEYTFYVPEAESDRLRELLSEVLRELAKVDPSRTHGWLREAARELGVVNE